MSGQPSITDLSETSNSAPASNANPPGPMSRTVYDPRLSNDRAISATIPCNPESKWLLVCTRAVQRPTSLFHLDVGSTTSDQQFFKLLRQTYVQAKKHWYRGLSFKRVRSIRFVQVRLLSPTRPLTCSDAGSLNCIPETWLTCAKFLICPQPLSRTITCTNLAIYYRLWARIS